MNELKKVLFVEDDTEFQNRIKMFFKADNILLVSAYDGESGVKMTKEENPDLILLDLVLPKKEGFKVLEEIKGDTRLSQIPVIILTNLEGSQDIERALSLGALAYLVKANYSLSDILDKVKEILQI